MLLLILNGIDYPGCKRHPPPPRRPSGSTADLVAAEGEERDLISRCLARLNGVSPFHGPITG
jgi:hypothetical protein